MAMVEFSKPFLWLKLTQFVLGIVCYALYFGYYWEGGTSAVRDNITQVAAVAFPFVVLPVIVLVSFIEGEGLADHMICALFSFCGFLVALIAGSVTVAFSHSGGVTAAGAMTIIFSFAFLADCIWYAFTRFKSKG